MVTKYMRGRMRKIAIQDLSAVCFSFLFYMRIILCWVFVLLNFVYGIEKIRYICLYCMFSLVHFAAEY